MNAISSHRGRVGVLEDDADLRLYLEQIIQDGEDLQLAFAVGTVAAAIAQVESSRPDLCLVDLQLPDGSGLDFIAALKKVSNARCLILTILGDRQSVLTALRAGADGYLLKDTAPGPLRHAMLATLAGETPISPRAASFLLELWKATSAIPDRSPEGVLTAREVDVLVLFSRGLSYRETAAALGISAHTIGDHVKTIYRKLDVHSRSEAIFEARQLGLMSPRD